MSSDDRAPKNQIQTENMANNTSTSVSFNDLLAIVNIFHMDRFELEAAYRYLRSEDLSATDAETYHDF